MSADRFPTPAKYLAKHPCGHAGCPAGKCTMPPPLVDSYWRMNRDTKEWYAVTHTKVEEGDAVLMHTAKGITFRQRVGAYWGLDDDGMHMYECVRRNWSGVPV